MAIEIARYSTETYEQTGMIKHSEGQVIGVNKSGHTPDGNYFQQMTYEIVDEQTVVFSHRIQFEGMKEEAVSLRLQGDEINKKVLTFDLEGFPNQRGHIKFKP